MEVQAERVGLGIESRQQAGDPSGEQTLLILPDRPVRVVGGKGRLRQDVQAREESQGLVEIEVTDVTTPFLVNQLQGQQAQQCRGGRDHAGAGVTGLLDQVAARLGDLAAERSRPLRLAVVGEFNAGKSTFINALIGADIAPTGVLPTTATLHHLRWGPDSFAKILFVPGHEPAERIVALADLRPTLRTLDPEGLARVEIRMPLSALVQVEILDTPGFNAPDPRHTESARAAFNEADIAIWLFDATQAMKQTERAVLEEAQRAKVPLQMLLNKADRLGPEAMTRVMVAVTQALSETRIESWGPPLALSAKLALAGKLGDPAALASSGWPAVERLLGEQIVD